MSQRKGSVTLLATFVALVSGLVKPKVDPFNFSPKQPQAGNMVRTLCLASEGSHPMSMSWLFNGKRVDKSERNLEIKLIDETSLMIKIHDLSFANIGNYSCLASNAAGFDSHTVALTYEGPPKWKNQPAAQVDILRGRMASFPCDATGYPPPLSTWSRSLLTLGPYVKAHEQPKIEPFVLTPRTQKLGGRANAQCVVSQGDLPMSITWTLNNKEIKHDGKHFKINTFDYSSSLAIYGINVDDVGNISCHASNPFGMDTFTVSIYLEIPPTWLVKPSDKDILVGRQVEITCVAKGYPKPTTSWFHSEGLIQILRNDVRMRVSENGTLVINDVNEKDVGKYVCQVDNGVGEKLSATLQLRVHEPPIMISEFQTITSKRGELTRLVCKAKGETPIIWEWSREDKLLGMSHGDRHEITEEHKPGFVTSELVLRDSKTEDAGIYLCKAKNKFGETSGTLELTVLEPPQPPVDLKVAETSSRFVRLLWKPSYSGNTPIVHYNVRYWTNEGKGRRLQEVQVKEETTALINKLHPGVRYYAVVAAENSVGSGTPSQALEFTTTEEEPSSPPTDVAIQVTESTSLKVTWKTPPKDTWNGRLTNYQVGFRKHGTELAYRFELVRARDAKLMELALSGLDPATRYDVIVRAINEAGMGPWSPEITATTSTGNPPKSPQLRVVSSTSHSLQLEWDVHGSPKLDTVKQFVLEYGRAGKLNEKVHIPGSKRKLLLRGLEGNIRYELRMASYNEHGLSAFSPTVSETTMDFQSEAMIQENEATPFYLRLYFIVPVAVSVTVVVSTLVVAWACVARTRALESASHLLRETPYDYCAKMPLAPVPQAPSQMTMNTGTMRPDHRPPTLEEAYDLPWDMTLSDGSYTRLQNGDGRRTMRADHNRRSR